VLSVLYVMYTAGHTATAGPSLYDTDLGHESIRLARLLHAVPDDAEAAGLLALMLLTDARREARMDIRGTLVPLDEQDQSKWDRTLINDGTRVLCEAPRDGIAGPYLLQAAIAAVHDEAGSTDATDWQQILILYKLLEHEQGNPIVTLNRAVVEAMVHGPRAGLTVLDEIQHHAALRRSHRLFAVRAHLNERAGDPTAAFEDYSTAARLTLNTAEQRYLHVRAARVRRNAVSCAEAAPPPGTRATGATTQDRGRVVPSRRKDRAVP
jgi:predicted RNA polymerase sigma factor